MNRDVMLERLNEQMNREIGTFLRYIVQAASIRGVENEPIREMYLAEVGDEVGHAQYLANQIVELGGEPRVEPDLPGPTPEEPSEMLARDAEEEAADVRRYRQLVTLADDAGLAALKMQLEEQAADEDRHRQEMSRLMGSTSGVPGPG